MAAPTEIVEVTVHRDGAWVTRRGRGHAGVHAVFDLPVLHEADALVVEVADGLATDVEEVAAVEEGRIRRGVRFDLLVAAEETSFQVRYFVPGARWAVTDGALLVAHTTGEDWMRVRLRVSESNGRPAPRAPLRGASGPTTPRPADERLVHQVWALAGHSGSSLPTSCSGSSCRPWTEPRRSSQPRSRADARPPRGRRSSVCRAR